MSNTVSLKPCPTPEAFSISISIAPLTYSSSDCATVSSCDHSMLKPTVAMSMHGRGTSMASLTWTVLHSITRPPASQESAMFCAIWVCGPAAGPNGVEARRWPKATDRSRPG